MQPPYPLVFFCSLTTLSFEILLIRIFSIRLSYHYASLIISLSMTGLVIGGLIVYFGQRRRHFSSFPSSRILHYFAAALTVSCPAVFILLSVIPLDHVRMLWEKIQVVYLVVFISLYHPIFSVWCFHFIHPFQYGMIKQTGYMPATL